MGKTQKKNSKGRLDKYYYLAKEKGYRARSSFKIIQINEKYGHFLERSKVVIDLCAAPGSWCQVASNLCPINSLIIGVDIVPIKPLPNCITFQSDITTEDCRSKLRGYMKTWKADTVLHDGAPNVGLGWVQDAFTQSHLTLQALKLAVENLVVGGTFVTKIFRSKDYNKLIWVFQQLFEKVEATKPPASRNVSAEIFVVCRGFKAPKKMDPRLLDPKEVFEELPDGPKNNEVKIYNPERKVRKRQGYEEGDYLLYHTDDIMNFVKTEEPIDMLANLNKFTLDETKEDWRILKKMDFTTKEFLSCIEDLKVLGRKDFKMILKWRKYARETLELDDDEDSKKDKEGDDLDKAGGDGVVAMTEEEKITKELQDLQEKHRLTKKREKRKKNEMKQKEIVRMQMNMLTPKEIGLDAGSDGRDTLFNLKTAEKTGQLDDLIKGKKRMLFSREEVIKGTEIVIDDDAVLSDRDDMRDADDLEAEMDLMYEHYKERKVERDANFKAKQSREEADNWDGFNNNNNSNKEDIQDSDYEMDDDGAHDGKDGDEEDSDSDEAITRLISRLKGEKGDQTLSRNARSLFNDPIFDNVEADLPGQSEPEVAVENGKSKKSKKAIIEELPSSSDDDEEDVKMNHKDDFEIVPNKESSDEDSDYDSDEEKEEDARKKHEKDIELATVSAMTLAHELALGQKTKHDLMDEGFNRYSFRDRDNLPEWFVQDEKEHTKINKPITKEAAMAIKERLKALNARPIKKVAEAKARKRMRAVTKLEKLKKKAGLINDNTDKSERDKADEISKLMKRVKKKANTKPKVTLVVASGSNKRLSGRPKGVRGKYKMVDGVLKNESKALRRIAKNNRGKKK